MSERFIIEKNFDKFVVPLAEDGQLDALQMYCANLSPMSTFNSTIIRHIKKLEDKPIKTARDMLTLYSYYKWYVDKATFERKRDIQNTEEYLKTKKYYNLACQELYRKKAIDPIANLSLFLLDKRNKTNFTNEQYARNLFNLRNQLYATAYRQINEEKKLKLLLAYSWNLVRFAPDNEFRTHIGMVRGVVASLQKQRLSKSETK